MPAPGRAHPLPALLATALVLGASARAGAESALQLPWPERFGEIAADTYDQDTGERIGAGRIGFLRGSDGTVRMEASTGIEGGARTQVVAELAERADGGGLRILRQESRSVDVAGKPMGVLEIDHRAGEGRCTGPANNGTAPTTRTIDLPENDRVVNVPLNLLFQPMVRGELQEMKFQLLLCGGGPRIVTAVARVAEPGAWRADGERLLRIQYELSLPKMLSRMVKRWLPNLSFWFDPNDAGAWIGHEMPLYSKGPTVLMVRQGYTPARLGALP